MITLHISKDSHGQITLSYMFLRTLMVTLHDVTYLYKDPHGHPT